MQERRFKINILDLAIVIAVICSVAVLVFRDNIVATFGKPELATLQINVSIDGAGNVESVSDMSGIMVTFEPESGENVRFGATVASVTVMENAVAAPYRADATLTVVGYQKLGKYYTETGERIYTNTECALTFGDERVEGTVASIEIIG